MTKQDIEEFIEEMESIGDIWTPEQVKDVYSDCTLGEALADRKSSLGSFFDIIGKVINSDLGDNLMTWVCDHCDSAMEELEENEDWKRIHCPNCGTERYVDGDNQYINEQAKPDAMHRALQGLIK